MFRCHVCGATQSRNETHNPVFLIDLQTTETASGPRLVRQGARYGLRISPAGEFHDNPYFFLGGTRILC